MERPVGPVVPGWEPRPLPAPVPLTGRYVRLEPVALEHAEVLHEALCGPDDAGLWTYRPTDPPADVAGRREIGRAACRERGENAGGAE